MFHRLLLSLLGVIFLAKLLNATNVGVASWDFGNYNFPDTNSLVKFRLKLFAPTKPGQYPVNIFLTGFNGITKSDLYTSLVEEIVVKAKTIVIAFDGFRLPLLPKKMELIFASTVNWTLQNVDDLFNIKSTPSVIKGKVFPDLKTNGISLMGHSAAGHTLVSYLVKQCGLATSLVLLEPVDGYDPFGIVKTFVTKPPAQLPFAIPTLIAATGLGAVPLLPILPACAPYDMSNYRFYKSLSGPTWYMNFTQYGHNDFLNDVI